MCRRPCGPGRRPLQSRRIRRDGAGTVPATLGMYLKKHRARTWATRLAAAFGTASPPSPGRVEAENALALQSLGINVMPLMACGEKLHADGRLESFFLSEELEGYCELQDFIQRRFPSRNTPSPRPSPEGRGRLARAAPLDRSGGRHRPAVPCGGLQSPRLLLLPLPGQRERCRAGSTSA